ncbi:MAG: IS66 family insertion sequence element accessory protein TnpB [Alphaproteobacteria bacterium]|nr:IS66 family insertion sequence element accessory protein TnpB [Alphaproteobacteria bacterium]
MFRFDADLRVFVHREPIDFRSGINSLATIVEQSMGLSPFQRAAFAFCNRGRKRIKLLFYLHPDKTRQLAFGFVAATNRERGGQGKPDNFNFLGFIFVCGRDRRERNSASSGWPSGLECRRGC